VRLLLAVLLALVFAAPAAADVEYTVTDLSLPGQPTLDAWGVNDDGVVVGTMNTGAAYSGFRWTEQLGLRPVEGKNAIPRDVSPSGVTATDQNHIKMVLSEAISHPPDAPRRGEVQRLAAAHGLNLEDLLRTRRNGYIITVTSKGFAVVR
jgi:hypothetical protein